MTRKPRTSEPLRCRLADEHAALRRVATLVAAGVETEQGWETVRSELGELCQANRAVIVRYEPPDSITFAALWSPRTARSRICNDRGR